MRDAGMDDDRYSSVDDEMMITPKHKPEEQNVSNDNGETAAAVYGDASASKAGSLEGDSGAPIRYNEETSGEITPSAAIYGDAEASDIYKEETAAEIAPPTPFRRHIDAGVPVEDTDSDSVTAGTGIGIAALVLSILSLFTMPILFGAAGIILGFIAQRKGSLSLGAWSIGIGALSIIIGIFIMPFF
ncbi:DUF4190 domain-containing protein [Actinomycetes bacterium NPDC127524]